MIHLRTPEEMDVVAKGGAIIAGLLEELEARVAPGLSTADLDAFCEEYIVGHDGAEPAFKGYRGYPASLCASVNDEVVHGIPSKKRTLNACTSCSPPASKPPCSRATGAPKSVLSPTAPCGVSDGA